MTRHHVRRLVVTLLVLALSGAASPLDQPVAPAHAAEAATVLRGTNTMIGAGARGARVVIPRPARLSTRAFGNRDVSLHGRRGVAALALVKEPVRKSAPQWIASRWPWCSADGCSARDRTIVHTINWPSGRLDGGELLLAPGTYRVYLFSSRGETSASLRVSGLAGSTSVPLSRDAFGAAGSRRHPGGEVPTGEVRIALDQQDLPATGAHLFAARVDSPNGNYGGYQLSECVARLAPDPPRLFDPPHSCSNDTGVDFGGPALRDEMWSYSPLHPGSYAAAATYGRAGSATPPAPAELMWAWLAFE